jgi:hypothetical protein
MTEQVKDKEQVPALETMLESYSSWIKDNHATVHASMWHILFTMWIDTLAMPYALEQKYITILLKNKSAFRLSGSLARDPLLGDVLASFKTWVIANPTFGYTETGVMTSGWLNALALPREQEAQHMRVVGDNRNVFHDTAQEALALRSKTGAV